MKIFVAGGTGAIGRHLVPQLIDRGHEVIVLVRSSAKAGQARAMGARPALANALDRDELTAWLRAARLAGARRFIAQSFCGWPFAREGVPVKREEDPLDATPPASFSRSLAAIRHLETAVRQAIDVEALALRYGFFYGPGTAIAKDGIIVEMLRKRRLPIVGGGTGIWSFVHVDDAARATATAVTRGDPGIYHIVDDEPAPVASWLPLLAEVLGARPPRRVPVWLARFLIGDGGVSMMTQIRGASNAKAKHALAWQPLYATWRRGFVEGLG